MAARLGVWTEMLNASTHLSAMAPASTALCSEAAGNSAVTSGNEPGSQRSEDGTETCGWTAMLPMMSKIYREESSRLLKDMIVRNGVEWKRERILIEKNYRSTLDQRESLPAARDHLHLPVA